MNHLLLFSEALFTELTDAEKKWLSEVLSLRHAKYRERLEKLLDIPTGAIDSWPNFHYSIEDALWVYSMDYGDLGNLEILGKAFLRKFRPGEVVMLTYAEIATLPCIGEFNGGWLVISSIGCAGGNSQDAAYNAMRQLKEKFQ